MNFSPGSWPRVSARSVVVTVAAMACLYGYYQQFSITKDPLTASTIAAAVATFDKIVHWLYPDDEGKLKAEIDRLKKKCGEA